MKRVVEYTAKTSLEHSNKISSLVVPNNRTYATLAVGYLEKSSVANTQTHPQVVQKNISGEIITENKRAGVTHSEKLNPQHEKKLPPVLQSYFIGLDVQQKKNQYCYHFDKVYTPSELAKFKENPEITNYFNENATIRDKIHWNFALLRGLEHKKEMERILPVSEQAFQNLEEKLNNK